MYYTCTKEVIECKYSEAAVKPNIQLLLVPYNGEDYV